MCLKYIACNCILVTFYFAYYNFTAVPIRWYVMTSVDTDDKTQAFFKDNNYFGLNEENIVFFMQGLLPCLTKEGKIMMESACQVAMAPDGNGGLYQGTLLSPPPQIQHQFERQPLNLQSLLLG